jgi:hypothetical protein
MGCIGSPFSVIKDIAAKSIYVNSIMATSIARRKSFLLDVNNFTRVSYPSANGGIGFIGFSANSPISQLVLYNIL